MHVKRILGSKIHHSLDLIGVIILVWTEQKIENLLLTEEKKIFIYLI